MEVPDAELIEKFQLLLQKEPTSKVFAPLCEAYRKMGLLEEAMRVCMQGLRHHPHFSGGRVAMARLYMEKNDWYPAVEQLKKAADVDPNNILAHSLLGQCYLNLKKPKEALKSYKMTLLLSPDHKQAQKVVKKLESLTADEYEEEVFAMKRLDGETLDEQTPVIDTESAEPRQDTSHRYGHLERYISLADAFIARSDFEAAHRSLSEAERKLGPHDEIDRRFKMLKAWEGSSDEDPEEISPLPHRKQLYREENVRYLQSLLKRVAERKRDLKA